MRSVGACRGRSLALPSTVVVLLSRLFRVSASQRGKRGYSGDFFCSAELAETEEANRRNNNVKKARFFSQVSVCLRLIGPRVLIFLSRLDSTSFSLSLHSWWPAPGQQRDSSTCPSPLSALLASRLAGRLCAVLRFRYPQSGSTCTCSACPDPCPLSLLSSPLPGPSRFAPELQPPLHSAEGFLRCAAASTSPPVLLFFVQ